jgi:hypothetical protein
MREATREVCGGVICMHAPPAPFVPAEMHGSPVVAVLAAHWGGVAEGAEVLAPLKQYRDPPIDLMGPTTYLDFQAITDAGNPPGRRNYWRSELLPDAPDEAIDALIACAAESTSPASVLVLGRVGGAVSDVPEDATALSGRAAEWLFCYAIWTEPDDARHIAWARATEEALRPWTIAGMALNFVSDIDNHRVRTTFGAAKYHRLVRLKRRWDPENMFSMNQNISPEG